MKRILEKKNIPTLLLAGIILIGIFLRTYQFEEWMVFNPDQARDAFLVKEMLEGGEWPLLGPQSGNTEFKLGPFFYYLEFFSAKIFGLTPAILAYPDLLLSILSILLLFIFLGKYFSKNITLALTFLYAVSFFMVYYSRFAFNPNSIQFYALLFILSLFEILDGGKKEKLTWSITLGLSVGMGIQLHALLILIMPVCSLIFFAYWCSVEKRFFWKSLLVVFSLVIFLNLPQIISESKTGWSNYSAFLSGAEKRATDEKIGFLDKLSENFLCRAQGYGYITSGLGAGDKCIIMNIPKRIYSNIKLSRALLASVAFGIILLSGGYALLLAKLKMEKDRKRKNFLKVLALYAVISFLAFLPVATGISIRYFIVEAFVCFVFLGLWLEQSVSWMKRIGIKRQLLFFIISLLVSGNVFSLVLAFDKYAGSRGTNADFAIFGEIEKMGLYILENSDGMEEVYFTGKEMYEKRLYKPLEYVLADKGLRLVEYRSKDADSGKYESHPIFYVTGNYPDMKKEIGFIKDFEVVDLGKFQNIAILKTFYVKREQ